MRSIPIGSLVRDLDQRDIGIVVGPLVEMPMGRAHSQARTQLVLWPCNRGQAMEMDLSVIEAGRVEVLSEAR